jgi:acetone carboxylase gamma subunit
LITPKGINRIGRYHDDFCKFLESVIKIETQQSKKNNLLPHERRIIVIDDTKKLFVSTAIFYTVNEARKLFKFQAGHPISGTAYGMAEVLPNLYVVLCGFHDYFKQLKRDAFIGLCANLGAKEIAIEDYEENGKKIDVSVNGTLASMPVGGNIKGGYVQNKNTGKKIAYAFTEKNKLDPNYTSPWIETEPSWEKMRELRIKNHVESFDAEFNYTDEMGINANIAATFVQFGVGIGGSFSEMTKIKIKYHVDFWE